MNSLHPGRIAAALVVVLALWLAWWLFGSSPEDQLRAAQAALIEAVEDRDWDDVKDLLAEDYTDGLGHTRESAVKDGQKYFAGFFSLTLKTEPEFVAVKGQGSVKTMIRMEGNGAGYSQAILGRVNQINTPWVFHWNNPGRWPWGWRLNMIHNDELR